MDVQAVVARSADDEPVLTDLLFTGLIRAGSEQVKQLCGATSRLLVALILFLFDLELAGPVLEDLAVGAAVSLHIFTLEDYSEC